MLRRRRRRRSAEGWLERGQALAETALVMVILVLLLSGIIDLGRAFFTYLALHNAAGEGAYYGAAFPLRERPGALPSEATRQYPSPDNIQFRAMNEVPNDVSGLQLVNWDNAVVTVTYEQTPTLAAGAAPGTFITVTIDAPFELIGPLPGLMGWNGEFDIQARASQTILTNREDD